MVKDKLAERMQNCIEEIDPVIMETTKVNYLNIWRGKCNECITGGVQNYIMKNVIFTRFNLLIQNVPQHVKV